MTHRPAFLARFRRNERGVALIEFALTAPLFLLILMGIVDYSWQMYAKQVLEGAVSKAARDSTLEGNAADQDALDAAVRERVLVVFNHADITFDRKAYESFDAIGDPEPFTDANNNNRYDGGECFEDLNGTGSWDADRGSAGNGGAEDVVLYTASMTFDRMLPVWRMLGQPQESTLSATTVLRNQPYNVNTETSEVICS
ncbi:MAG: pilus assembly protein [Sphingopyxis sp.]|uniref:TadE/TadG family type IV pilus assembly protein n=1 Tax=Sphingopyxis sp. TaxID=1908224 RepID=UPI003D80D822